MVQARHPVPRRLDIMRTAAGALATIGDSPQACRSKGGEATPQQLGKLVGLRACMNENAGTTVQSDGGKAARWVLARNDETANWAPSGRLDRAKKISSLGNGRHKLGCANGFTRTMLFGTPIEVQSGAPSPSHNHGNVPQ